MAVQMNKDGHLVTGCFGFRSVGVRGLAASPQTTETGPSPKFTTVRLFPGTRPGISWFDTGGG